MKKLYKYNRYIIVAIIILMVFLPIFSAKSQTNIDILDISVVQDIDDKIVEIKWSTNVPVKGKIVFGESEDNLSSFVIKSKLSKHQSIKLGNLKDETDYYYKVIAYNDIEQVESFIKKFDTDDFIDIRPPILKNIKVAYISGTAAVITWETNEMSTSYVEYDENITYKKRAGSRSRVTEHLLILKNLKPDTQYFLRVYSQDKKNNKSSFSFREFTTRSSDKVDKEDFAITHLRPAGPNDSNISTNSVKVSFETNRYAFGDVVLSKKGMRSKKINLDYGLKHVAVFSDLAPDSAYTINISMKDIFGKREKENLIVTTNKTITVKVIDTHENGKDVVILGEEFSFFTPARALYKTKESPRVYSIINNKRHYIASLISFWEYGYEWKDVETISEEELLKYPQVKLVKSPDSPAVYYLYRQSGKILKIQIPSPTVFNSYSNNSWGDIVKISQSDIDSYGEVKLIKIKHSPDVYYIENGAKRFVSAKEFRNRGFLDSDIMIVNSTHLDNYQTGKVLDIK